MNSATQPNEPQETFELAIKVPTDDSLPAAQVLADQSQNAGETFAPRFIP